MSLNEVSPDFTALTYVCLHIITAVGLGSWLVRRAFLLEAPGISIFLGFFSIPVLLYCFNSILGLNLFRGAHLVFGIALVGLIRHFIEGKLVKPRIGHPVWIGLSLLCLYAVAGCFTRYFPYRWDEFGHWMLMPKQIYRYGTAISDSFSHKLLLEYTPGQSLLIDYPFFVLGKGQYRESLLPLINGVGAIGLLGAIFDSIALATKKNDPSRFWAFAAVACAALLSIPTPVLSEAMLIESTINQLAGGLFLILILVTEGTVEFRRVLLWLGLIATSGVLAKKSFVCPVAAVSVGLFYFIWNAQETVKNRTFRVLGSLILLWSGPIVVMLTWSRLVAAAGAHPFFRYETALSVTNRSQWVFLGFLLYRYAVILIVQTPLCSAFILSSFFLNRKNTKYHVLFISLFIHALLFFAGMFVIYVTAFSPYKWNSAPSFQRYASFVYESAGSVGLVLLTLFAARHWGIDETKWRLRKSLPLLTTLLFALLIWSSVGLIRSRAPEPFVSKVGEVLALIDLDHKAHAKLLVINQEETWTYRARFEYATMRSEGTVIERFKDDRFGPVASDNGVGRGVATEKEFIERAKLADYIWVFSSDSFADDILNRHLKVLKQSPVGLYAKVNADPIVYRPIFPE